ncbi:MAG: PQQ-binding-like beta-propeller repeat protein [Verrucomicrobiales bacterium]
MAQQNLFIGSNGYVCAIHFQTGVELWRTKLQRGLLKATNYQDVSVIVRDGVIYAGSQGHLFALSADTGHILWHNELKGLGFNDISLALDGHSIQFLQKTVGSNNNSGHS